MSTSESVLNFLESRGVRVAMIGGAALAVYGVARATLDVDFLTDDARILGRDFWSALESPQPDEIRRGEADDPLAGVVRWTRDVEPIDLVLGRGKLASEILARRVEVEVEGVRTPVVEAPDLLLLKLAAGGPQDLLDIAMMLRADPGDWRPVLLERLESAPPDLKAVWERISSS